MSFYGLRQLERPADYRVQLLLRQPAVDVVGTAALLLRFHVEHGQTEEREAFHVEGSDRKERLSLATGDDNDSAPGGHQRHGALEVRLPLSLVPNVHALSFGEFLDLGWH